MAAVMIEVAKIEMASEPPHWHSFMPYSMPNPNPNEGSVPPGNEIVEDPSEAQIVLLESPGCNPNTSSQRQITDEEALRRFFPCHYFDYFVGTSTGG